MKTSRMARMQNGLGLVLLRMRIGRAWWLPALFLLTTAVTVKAETNGNFTYEINQDSTIIIMSYIGSGGVVVIPSTIASMAVTSIYRDVFRDCTSLTGVTIPNSVTYIGDDVFNGCTSLTNVMIGNGVTSIGNSAFWYCTSLTAITVDALNSVYSSLDGVLFNKSQTTLIQCPGGKVGSYTIPNSVTNIGVYAFDVCYSLTGVTIPTSVISIEMGAFYRCGLTSVTIPNSITNIKLFTFRECTSLTNVTIPNSVSSIGESAFESCNSLTRVTIPASVTIIGNGAFSSCYYLSAITVDALNAVYSSLDGVLFNKSQTTLIQCPGRKAGSYTIPASVTSIEDNAFYWCTSLTGVTIPNSVTSIGNNAFEYCTSLTSVTIGTSVTSIGNGAFYRCTSLTGVYFWGNAPSIGSDYVFEGATNATVYYLAGTTGWGTTFGGRPTALWNPPPRPTITANGVTGTVTIHYPEAVSITVEMNAGNYAGTEVDWWVVALAGSSWYYLNSSTQWIEFDGNLSNCHPVNQGGLFNLPAMEVLNMTGLQTGSYTFWFAVDYPMDGILDLDGQILLNSVNVIVQ